MRRPTCQSSEYKIFQHPRVHVPCKSECQRKTLVCCYVIEHLWQSHRINKCSDGSIYNISMGYLPPRILNFRPILMETTPCSSHSDVIIRNCEKDHSHSDQYCSCSSMIFAPRQANISHSTPKIN